LGAEVFFALGPAAFLAAGFCRRASRGVHVEWLRSRRRAAWAKTHLCGLGLGGGLGLRGGLGLGSLLGLGRRGGGRGSCSGGGCSGGGSRGGLGLLHDTQQQRHVGSRENRHLGPRKFSSHVQQQQYTPWP
jgi:hypothetical protein